MAARVGRHLATLGLILTLFTTRTPAQVGGFSEPIVLRTQIVSSAVIATWGGAGDAGGGDLSRLRFLVLWRGAPGWMWPGPFGTRGESRGGRPGMLPRVIGQQISVGSITFGLDVDLEIDVAHIGAEEIPLRVSNVILVDQVDRTAGRPVIRKMWVAPDLPAPDRFEVVIQREPELRAFIRCDVHFQDLTQEEVARLLCAKTLEER